MRDNNRCIYNIDKDIVDTQVVSLEYETGLVANFTLALNCVGPRSGRNVHAIGTRGRVFGEFATGQVHVVDNQSEQAETIDCEAGDGSGHGGGDRSLALELLRMLDDPAHRPIHSMQAGYESAIACMAADISRCEGRRVDVSWNADGTGRIH